MEAEILVFGGPITSTHEDGESSKLVFALASVAYSAVGCSCCLPSHWPLREHLYRPSRIH